MADIVYKIARYGDRRWIDLVHQALKQRFFTTATFAGVIDIGQLTISHEDGPNELLQLIADQNGGVLRSVTAHNGGLNLIIREATRLSMTHWN
jgi:hypothetical protein